MIGNAMTMAAKTDYAARYATANILYFDPSGSGSTGTLADPYSTEAQVQAVITAASGNMAGKLLACKRGTTYRGGFDLTGVYGGVGSPFVIAPYGDAEALPIFNGAVVRSDWVAHTSDIWKLTGVTANQDIWQNDLRVWKKTSLANMTAANTSFWDSGTNTLYLWPADNENPNLGQVEITSAAYGMHISYKNVVGTGNISIIGTDCRYGTNSALRFDPDTASDNNAATGLIVSANKAFGGGVDKSGLSDASDAIIVVGPTTSATGCYIGHNEAAYCLNNAIEVSFLDGAVIEHNLGYDVGGNAILEMWASCKNNVVRYNKGLRASTSGRIYTTFHAGGVWLADRANITGTTYDTAGTLNGGNLIYGNLLDTSEKAGMDIYSGLGNRVFQNTLINTGNRALKFATDIHASVVAASCEFSQNLIHATATGSGFGSEFKNVPGTFDVTGDKNHYYFGASAPKWRTNGTNQTLLSTYKTAVSPAEANSLSTVLSSAPLDSNYRPTAASAVVNAGAAVTGWSMDMDGNAILGNPTIGCYQVARQTAPTVTVS